jgi:2-polyprenyl-3-methyl-5-hydroxy-6-metoxy-1,4-benzoquinol methylase
MNLEEMYTWWNDSAKHNAMAAILSNRSDWNAAAFFESGHEWLQQHLSWAAMAGFTPGGNRALDFGCGVGRMTNALARHYGSVVGVDISDEMIRLARRNARSNNVQFTQVKGTLIPEGDRSFDLVHSTIVIQHIAPPFNLEAVSDLFRPDGGCVLFDAPSHKLRATDPEPDQNILRSV